MNIKSSKSEIQKNQYVERTQKDNLDSLIRYGQNKIKQIQRRISENEIKLESMESHSDYDYKDLLRESNEIKKDYKKDLQLFVDMLCKYNMTVK